jgi:hypothetical protein
MRAGDFSGALAQLEQLREDRKVQAEAAQLEAACWLGKALVEDGQIDEALVRLQLSVSLKEFFQSNRQKRPDAFLESISGSVSQYLAEAEPAAAHWLKHFKGSLEYAQAARARAQKAYTETNGNGAGHSAAASLLAWSQLYEWLVVVNAQTTLDRLASSSVLPEQTLAAAREALPNSREQSLTEDRFRTTVVSLIAEARAAGTPDLPLALADCLTLFSAATGRLQTGPFLWSFVKYTTLPRTEPPAPPGGIPEPAALSGNPADELVHKRVAVAVSGSPESLILPLYQLAARLDSNDKNAAAQYAFFMILLRLNESEAGKRMQKWDFPAASGAAFALEKARFAAREKKNAEEAVTHLMDALRAGRLHRPVFLSLPQELHGVWLSSRYMSELSPRFALSLEPLFSLLDLQAGEARKTGGPELQYLTLRLRLSELLSTSNFLPDVVLGLTQANGTIGRLSALKLPEEQAAQVELYRRRIEDAVAKLPPTPVGLVVTPAGIRPLQAISVSRAALRAPLLFVVPRGGGMYLPPLDKKLPGPP